MFTMQALAYSEQECRFWQTIRSTREENSCQRGVFLVQWDVGLVQRPRLARLPLRRSRYACQRLAHVYGSGDILRKRGQSGQGQGFASGRDTARMKSRHSTSCNWGRPFAGEIRAAVLNFGRGDDEPSNAFFDGNTKAGCSWAWLIALERGTFIGKQQGGGRPQVL